MSNKPVTVLASAARTATTNSDDQQNLDAHGARFYLNITAVSGSSPTLDVKVQAKDPVAGGYFDIPSAAFAQKTSTGSDDLTVYPGIAETSNETVSDVIPRDWRVVATLGGSSPNFTFSLGAHYLK